MDYSAESPVSHDFNDMDIPLLIFRDRMNGWFFEPATKLLQQGDSVAAIHIVTPLIEALQERYEGKSSKGKSADFFKKRAKETFRIGDDAAALLYAGLRCGFAHHGFLKDDERNYNILLTDGLAEAIEYVDSVLWIDSKQYIEKIRDAYEAYYAGVERDSELRRKFMAAWSDDWQMSLRVPGGAGTTASRSA
jgi:hypothetical protein